MGITDHFSVADVILNLDASSKQAVLHVLAAEAAGRLGIAEREILDALRAREQLGSTALGRGVALPHARLEGIPLPLLLFAKLQRPVDFDARDEDPVDLVILVLWPEASPEGFLPALSDICRSLREPQTLRRLRSAIAPKELLALLDGLPPGANLAPASRAGA